MILVTGGTGVIGSKLVKGLLNKGRKVRVLTLPGDPKISDIKDLKCEIVYGDITEPVSLKSVCKGINTIYHMAAIIISNIKEEIWRINVAGTENIINCALEAEVKHFIYVSSVAAGWPQGSDYAKSKVAAEELVKSQKEMKYTIIRPSLIYGPGGGQEFIMFSKYLRKYPIVPFIGRGNANKNPVFVDDIAKGLLLVLDNRKTYNKTYIFNGDEEISIYKFARLILSSQGISKPFIFIPVPLCKFIAFILDKIMKNPPFNQYSISRITHNIIYDNTEARKDLDFDPIGISEGIVNVFNNTEK